ncbi:MAG TPA: hypothetical protein VGI67_05575 [Thermoleophilaceae bacterium]
MPDARLPYEFAGPLSTARLDVRAMTTDDVDDVLAYQSRADVCRSTSPWGCAREAHFVEHSWFKGEWGDTGIYALLAASGSSGGSRIRTCVG